MVEEFEAGGPFVARQRWRVEQCWSAPATDRPGQQFDVEWFEAENGGVRVTTQHHPGRFWDLPIVGRLIADSYERDDRGVLKRLKAMLEAPSAH